MTEPSLQTALLNLDPAVAEHWTKGGEPLMGHIEDVLGDKKISRGEINKITGGMKRCEDWHAQLAARIAQGIEPASTEPAEETAGSGLGVSTITRRMPLASDRARGVTPGQVVLHQGKDIAPVLLTVTAVGDNGEIDAKAEITGETIAGLRHKSVVDQTPADDPARLQPFWDFAG